MPFSNPSSSRAATVPNSDAKSHHGKQQSAGKKRRQSFATDTTNYATVSGSWVQSPVLSSEPVSGVIPTSPSMTAGRTLYDQNSPPYTICQSSPPPKESKHVRFDVNDTVQEKVEEEELEWSDCMQRRLEQEVWYPYHPGYTQQGGPMLLPTPIQVQVPSQYSSQPMYLRSSPVPVWAPGYYPVGLHGMVLNPYAGY